MKWLPGGLRSENGWLMAKKRPECWWSYDKRILNDMQLKKISLTSWHLQTYWLNILTSSWEMVEFMQLQWGKRNENLQSNFVSHWARVYKCARETITLTQFSPREYSFINLALENSWAVYACTRAPPVWFLFCFVKILPVWPCLCLEHVMPTQVSDNHISSFLQLFWYPLRLF